jgi:hypothetical protein
MSFRKLVNHAESNATAYPPPPRPQILDEPITSRRFSDESDSDSNATSVSDDTETDDDPEHLLDYRARVLRRTQAQARVRNTLQYAHNRINDGARPAQDLANEIADDGDFLYNDVARPFLGEAAFHLRVLVTTIGRLLLQMLWNVMNTLWWTFWSTLDLIGETFLAIFYMVWVVIRFTSNLLCQIFFAIPQLLRDTPWWMLKPTAVAIGLVLIIISVKNGLVRMTLYTCNDSALAPTLREICNHTHTIAILNAETRELDRLVAASDAVIYSIADMNKIGGLDSKAGPHLLRESTALVQFAKTHSGSLDPLTKQHDIVAAANAVHSNATAFNHALEMFKHIHAIRVTELETKFKRILSVAKGYTPQSAAERFFLESASYYVPSTFSHTSVAHQMSHYAGVTSHFLNDAQTATILKQGTEVSRYMLDITGGIQIAEVALKNYQAYWEVDHQTAYPDHTDRNLVEPSDLAQRLNKALREVKGPAKSLNDLYILHRKVKQGMNSLRSNLKRLSKAASGHNQGDVDPASARAVLHQFVVELAAMDIMIGAGTYEISMTLGDGVAKGSKYKILPDGRRVPHSQAYG